MANIMSADEARLRSDLDRAVTRLRSALSRIPDVEIAAEVGLGEAASTIAEANSALRDALSATTLFDQLEAATEEAALLAATSRMALDMISHMLAIVCAEIDARAAA